MMMSNAATQPLAIGVDIGGTNIKGALISAFQLDELRHGNLNPLDELGEVVSRPTPKQTEAFLETIADLIRQLRKGRESEIRAVGVATAGIVDPYRGMILGSTGNLPAISAPFNLKEALEERTGCNITLENDANAAAFGEFRSGAALGSRNVLMVTLGTGVGGGIVLGGRILHGAQFSAGEIGHIGLVMDQDRQCTCGRWNCWEAYASGTGLRASFLKAVGESFGSDDVVDILRLAKVSKPEDLTTHHLIAAYQKDYPLARQVMADWHRHIAAGLGSVMNVLNPEVVVVGGGLNQFVDMARLKHHLEERVMSPVESTRLTLAMLDNHAGMIGAAYLALEQPSGKRV